MRKLSNLLFILSLLVFSSISHTAISTSILFARSQNSLVPINDKDHATIDMYCTSSVSDMYFNNDFLFFEKETRYNSTLEIYDVSDPQEMKLVKTYVHNKSYCHYESPENCLTGNDNYTFLHIEDLDYKRALVVFDMNSPNLTHMKINLPDSDYIIRQITVNNNYLYLVREPYDWDTDWQIEKYKINNPILLTLVSNISVSRSSYHFTKDNNSFIFTHGNINNWTNPYGSDKCSIKDAHYENNRLFVLMSDSYFRDNYFIGLLVIDVTNNESYQVLAHYPMMYVVNFDVVGNYIFIALKWEIVVLEITDYNSIKEISSYSFEYIYGDLMIMCYGSDLLFISKSSCSGRYFGTKEEDKAALVIFNVENPSEIIAIYPEGFDNRYHFFIDGGAFANIFFIPSVVGLTIVAIFIVFIFIRKRKMKKKV